MEPVGSFTEFLARLLLAVFALGAPPSPPSPPPLPRLPPLPSVDGPACDARQPRLEVVYEVLPSGGDGAVDGVVRTLRARLADLRLFPSEVAVVAADGGRVVLHLCGAARADATRVLERCTRPGRLAFRPVDERPEASRFIEGLGARLDAAPGDPGARGTRLVLRPAFDRERPAWPATQARIVAEADPGRPAGSAAARLKAFLASVKPPAGAALAWGSWRGEVRSYVLLAADTGFGARLASAMVVFEPDGQPYVAIEFDAEGAQAFGDYTAAHVGAHLAIEVDGEVLSAAIVKEAVHGGRVKLTLGVSQSPQQTWQEARALVSALGSPILARLRKVSERTVP